MLSKTSSVLVTGGSGYVASWIVKKLLDQGYTVHATVRSKSPSVKINHLLEWEKQFDGKLTLFEADLLKDGSFAESMKNCALVMHTASPFKRDVKNAQKELIDPALKGTQNVLSQASKTETVKRIVLTSSVAAIYGDVIDVEKTKNGIFTEEDWNTTSDLKHNAYQYSKKLAEEEAWKIEKSQNQWDLVVINPSLVMGPSLSKRVDGESAKIMLSILRGEFASGAPNLSMGIVDVRDVADAHILAGTVTEAKGRHITCAKTMKILEICSILKEEFGDKYKVPTTELPKFLFYIVGPFVGFSWKFTSRNIGYDMKFDNSYSKENLGLDYKPIKTTLIDHANQLDQAGLIK